MGDVGGFFRIVLRFIAVPANNIVGPCMSVLIPTIFSTLQKFEMSFSAYASRLGLLLSSVPGSDKGFILGLPFYYSSQSVDRCSILDTILVNIDLFGSDADNLVWSSTTR